MLKKLAEAMNQKGIKAVGLMVTREGENITAVISPVKTNGEPLPNLKVSNTAEELEKDFPSLLDRYAVVVGDNLADLEKASSGKKKSSSTKKTETKKSAEKPKEEKKQEPVKTTPDVAKEEKPAAEVPEEKKEEPQAEFTF